MECKDESVGLQKAFDSSGTYLLLLSSLVFDVLVCLFYLLFPFFRGMRL